MEQRPKRYQILVAILLILSFSLAIRSLLCGPFTQIPSQLDKNETMLKDKPLKKVDFDAIHQYQSSLFSGDQKDSYRALSVQYVPERTNVKFCGEKQENSSLFVVNAKRCPESDTRGFSKILLKSRRLEEAKYESLLILELLRLYLLFFPEFLP